MANPQFYGASSDPAAAKLLDIDAGLAVQEEQLLAQLHELQQKRASLKNVISLFGAQEDAANEAGSKENSVDTDTNELSVASESPSVTPARRKRSRASGQRMRSQRSSSTSTSRQSWRPYVQKGFAESATLPEMVFAVLNRHPDHMLSVSNIMNGILSEDVPKKEYQKVHRRLLNILSKGVKEKQWARGNKGEYSAIAGAETADAD